MPEGGCTREIWPNTDEEGYIYIRGRKKDMYISGGLNVYPAEIENVILKDPAVAEVAVIGVADQRWGEVGWAVIVCKEGLSVDTGAVKALCTAELAAYKVPKEIHHPLRTSSPERPRAR